MLLILLIIARREERFAFDPGWTFLQSGVQKRCYLGVKWLVNPWLVEWQCKVCRNVKKLIRSVQMRRGAKSGKTTIVATKNGPLKRQLKWTTQIAIKSSYRVVSIGWYSNSQSKVFFFINLSRLTDNICDVWISSKRELDENGTSARGCKALIFCTESETIKSRVEEGKEFWKLIGPRHRFNCHFGDTHSQ